MLKNTYLKEKLVYKGPISNVFKYYNTQIPMKYKQLKILMNHIKKILKLK